MENTVDKDVKLQMELIVRKERAKGQLEAIAIMYGIIIAIAILIAMGFALGFVDKYLLAIPLFLATLIVCQALMGRVQITVSERLIVSRTLRSVQREIRNKLESVKDSKDQEEILGLSKISIALQDELKNLQG